MITPFGKMNELFTKSDKLIAKADEKFRALKEPTLSEDPFQKIDDFDRQLEAKMNEPFNRKAMLRNRLKENVAQALASNSTFHTLFKSFSPVFDAVTDPKKFDSIIKAAADRYGLDPALLKAVIRQESNFNPTAVSKAGAMGLMQLMPETARWLGVRDPFDPVQNIFGGAKYLRTLLDKYNGDVRLALAAYNAGPANVDKYGDVPPFQETQDYVRNVLSFYEAFKNEGGVF